MPIEYLADYRFALYFKSNDTGSNVGKAPYLISTAGSRITVFEERGRNDSCVRFSINANDVTLTQGNFNQRNDAAAGNAVGYFTTVDESFIFIPREGFAYFTTSTNTIDVFMVGERPFQSRGNLT